MIWRSDMLGHSSCRVPRPDTSGPPDCEYHRAVSEIRELTELTDRRRFVDPAGKLAEHLITLYWRGRVTWDSHGGILQEFFDRAPQKARAHALEFVGRSLWRGQMPLAEDQ